MRCELAILIGLATTFSLGCKSNKKMEDRLTSLETKINQLELDNMFALKPRSAELEPTSTGYSIAVDYSGLVYPINIDNVEPIPGGAKYTYAITNIYSVDLTGVNMTIYYDDKEKKIDVPQDISAGRRFKFPVLLSFDGNSVPKKFTVHVSSNGMKFGNQY